MTRQHHNPPMVNYAPPRVVFGLSVGSSFDISQFSASYLERLSLFRKLSKERQIGIYRQDIGLHYVDRTRYFYKYGGQFRNALGNNHSSITDAINEMETFLLKPPVEEFVSPGIVPPTRQRPFRAPRLNKKPVEVDIDVVIESVRSAFPETFHSQASLSKLKKPEILPTEELELNENRKAHRQAIVKMQRAARADKPPAGASGKRYLKEQRAIARAFKSCTLNPQLEEQITFPPTAKEFASEFMDQVNIGLVHKLDPTATRAIEDICEKFSDIFERCKGNVEESVSEFRQSIDKGIGIAEGIKTFLWIALAATLGYFFFFKAPMHRVIIFSILAAVIPALLWDSIKYIFDIGYQSQGPVDMSWLSSIITIGMTFFLFGGGGLFQSVKNIFKTMPTYGRTVSGVSEVGAVVVSCIEACLNYIRTWFGKGPVSLMSTGKKDIDSFVDRVQQVVAQTNDSSIEPKDFLMSLQELRSRGAILLTQHRWVVLHERVLSKAVNKLDELIETLAPAIHAMKSTRIEPTVIGLVGAPRQGKSILMDAMSKFLLGATLPDKAFEDPKYDPRQFIYARCASSEYWTGYYRQWIVIIDDWGQSKPSPGDSSAISELINMGSPAPFCPNQAAVADKGKNYFDSPFVIISTNLVTLEGTASVIVSPAALAARLELSFRAVPKEKFRKYSPETKGFILDGERFTEESAACGGFPWHVWDFYKHDYNNPNGHFTPIPYETVLQMCVDRYRRNKSRFENVTNLDDSIVSLAKKFRSQVGLPFFGRRKKNSIDAPIPDTDPEKLPDFPEDKGDTTSTSWKAGVRKSLFSRFIQWHKDLQHELEENNVAIFKWLNSPIFHFVVGLVVTPFLTKFFISGVRTLIKYIFGLFKGLFGIFNPQRKERNRVSDIRKHATKLNDDDLDEVATFMVGKLKNKETPVVSKLCSHIFANQSNVPNYKVRQSFSSSVPPEASSQIMRSQNGQREEINDALAKNQFLLNLNQSDGNTCLGTLTVLENDFCMIPFHFISFLKLRIAKDLVKPEEKLKLVNVWTPQHEYNIVVDTFIKSVVFSDPDKDLAILKISSMQRRRSIVDKFILKADVPYLQKVNVRLEVAAIVRGTPTHYVSYGTGSSVTGVDVSREDAPRKLNGWMYDIHTVNGNCGSLVSLVGDDWTGSRRIIGFHSAGSGSKGLSNGLTREYLRDILKRLDSVENQPLPETKREQEIFFDQYRAGEALCVSDIGVSQNPTTNLFKTPLHNKWGTIDKVPALLHTKGVINPMNIVRAKYLRPHPFLQPGLVSRAAFTAFRPFRLASIDDFRGVLTNRQACEGVPALKYNGLKRGTSAGYPYNAMGMQGKREFFGSTGEFKFESAAFRDLEIEIDRIETLAKNNIRALHVFTDFLKDELRSTAKVEAGESRMISAAPLAYTILFRKYFGAFTSSVEKHRIETGPAVGMNPYTEWERIVRHLDTMGTHIVAGDYGGFDHTSRPQNQDCILEEIQSWYGDDHATVRRVLWKELTNSVHISGNPGSVARQIYSWVGGMPSGFPGTTTVNCFDNITDMILAYHDLTKLPIEDFWEYVALIVYGDDNIMSIHPHIIDAFNQLTIPSAMSKMGRKYTDDKKSADNTAPYRSLSEVTFLKRSFSKVGHQWLAPLDLESILLIPYWGKTHMGEKEILADMVECSLQELSLHESGVWEAYANRISEASIKYAKHVPRIALKQGYYLDEVLKRTESWF